MSTIERLKEIAAKGERWPRGAEVEVLLALPKLLAVVKDARAIPPGLSQAYIKLEKSLAALDEGEG